MARKNVNEKGFTVHPSVDRKYVESGIWKCAEAPINPDIPAQVAAKCGAHHWITLNDGSGESYCIHCYGVRNLEIVPKIGPKVDTVKKHRRLI